MNPNEYSTHSPSVSRETRVVLDWIPIEKLDLQTLNSSPFAVRVLTTHPELIRPQWLVSNPCTEAMDLLIRHVSPTTFVIDDAFRRHFSRNPAAVPYFSEYTHWVSEEELTRCEELGNDLPTEEERGCSFDIVHSIADPHLRPDARSALIQYFRTTYDHRLDGYLAHLNYYPWWTDVLMDDFPDSIQVGKLCLNSHPRALEYLSRVSPDELNFHTLSHNPAIYL